ncbi:MAG: tetratricopeptide repeat protein [Bacteroidia bacterium]
MRKVLAFCFCAALASCNQNATKETAAKTDTSTVKVPEPLPKAEVPPREVILKDIENLEKELYASQELNEEKAKKMISLYETYYNYYYKDLGCADYLFKAGEIAENINQPYRAIGFYTKCYEEYPMFRYNNLCLFRMANLYDYKLNNYIKAKALYMEVKEKFPKTDLAKDADAAIKMMGKSDQQMIQEFEKKNKVK